MKKRTALLSLKVLALPLLLLLQSNSRAQTSVTNAIVSGSAVSNAVKEADSFNFPGGSPRQLLNAVVKQYPVDLLSVADIPPEMEAVRVPRFHIDFENVASPAWQYRLDEIVKLYNRMAQEKPELGKLVVDPEPRRLNGTPSVVMLVPDKSSTAAMPELKIKAFPLRGIPQAQWQGLSSDVEKVEEEMRRYKDEMRSIYGYGPFLQGFVRIHSDTNLLIAYGSEGYVAMVESIVAAHQANQQAADKPK